MVGCDIWQWWRENMRSSKLPDPSEDSVKATLPRCLQQRIEGSHLGSKLSAHFARNATCSQVWLFFQAIILQFLNISHHALFTGSPCSCTCGVEMSLLECNECLRSCECYCCDLLMCMIWSCFSLLHSLNAGNEHLFVTDDFWICDFFVYC